MHAVNGGYRSVMEGGGWVGCNLVFVGVELSTDARSLAVFSPED